MGVKGRKAKGNAAEEFVAKQIRELYNLNDDEVYRSPNSGQSNRELGDIFIIKRLRESLFPFVLECKNHESWDIRSIFPNLNKTILGWYNKTKEECEGTVFEPVVIITKAYYPYYVVINEESLKRKDPSSEYTDLWDAFNNRTYFKCNNGFYIFLLEDFLSYVKECYG